MRAVRSSARALRASSRAMTSDTSSGPSTGLEFLLEQPLKLYRDCMRVADFLAHKQGYPRDVLRATVREPWRRHMHERDPEKIGKLREGAIRGLSNYMMYEASRGGMEGTPAFAPEEKDT